MLPELKTKTVKQEEHRLPEPLFFTTKQQAEEELEQLTLMNITANIQPHGNVWVIA